MVETLANADAAVVLWLNGWAGFWPWLDGAVRLLASDYLVPVLLSLMVLGMWIAPRDAALRMRHQRAAFTALAGMGFAALVVLVINGAVFRPRPFEEHVLTLLFYRPTDSSFPLHAAAVGFGFATGIWTGNRRLGLAAGVLAMVWSASRVMAGVAYPSDVLAGAAIGVAVAGAFSLVMRLLDPLFRLVLRAAQRLYLA